MNFRTVASVSLLALFAAPVAAQPQTDEIELTRAIIQAERQAIVAQNMSLTDEQGKVFWPLYRQYREEMARVGDRWIKMITTYAEHHESLTNEIAADLIREYLEIEDDFLALRKKYVREFSGVMEAKLVMRFFQIENKMDAITDVDIARQVPLAH